MMDEAQDTSDVEMRAVDILVENGTREMMLIGDPEQAIYEWRDAKPELLEEKYNQWEKNSILLDESWRSSQKICDFFHEISQLKTPPVAKNEQVRDCEISPEIWEYDVEVDAGMLVRFQSFCKSKNVAWTFANVAVLARGRDLVSKIQGRQDIGGLSPWQGEITEGVCESKFLFDEGKLKKGFERLERTLCSKMLNKDYCTSDEVEGVIRKEGFLAWRRGLYAFLCGLPKTDYSLGEWMHEANRKLKIIKNPYLDEGDLQLKGGRYKSLYEKIVFESLFGHQGLPVSTDAVKIGTIHSVKGETFEAVLVIFKEETVGRKKYSNLLWESTLASEELRIVYVAITRPRRVLVLAVPKSQRSMWETKFFK